MKVAIYLSSYATKDDLQEETGVDTSNLATKLDLARFKSELDKRHIDKLKTDDADLSKLNNAVDNDVVKKKLYMINKPLRLMALILVG